MSKEYLEAFKKLKQELYYSPNQIPDIDKWHEIIESALQRLEAIDNSNPSEALYGVDFLKDDGCIITLMQGKALEIIRQYILKAQEQEKVLSIINKKKVDIIYLKESNNVEEYNSHFGAVVCKLTPEEYDAVKRYFNG